jgi:hypothetical protein
MALFYYTYYVNKLLHSIENIYEQAGQYDWYCSFEFYFDSEAWNDYQGSANGLLIYTPTERMKLESIINSNEVSFSDGFVKLDTGEQNEEKKKLLIEKGFKASDIRAFYTVGPRPDKSYQEDNIKEIPNTINIDFQSDSNPDSLIRMEQLIFDKRLEENGILLKSEWIKYGTNSYLLDKSIGINSLMINVSNEELLPEAELLILAYKYKKSLHLGSPLITSEEYKRMSTLITYKKNERINIILRQLGISRNQFLDFATKSPNEHKELIRSIIQFEDRPLVIWGCVTPIYWDFERYTHIFLRHYRKFYISHSTKGQGTLFSYLYKDIIRLIEIVLESNIDEINNSIIEGKEYRRYKDKGYYFNGNYYTFRVSKEGKLLQFHPQE